MPFCGHCGQNLDQTTRFCPRCGQEQQPGQAIRQQNQPPVANQAMPATMVANGFSPRAQDPAFQDFARKMRRRAWIFLVILAIVALVAILILVKEDLLTIVLAWAVVVFFTAILSLVGNRTLQKTWEGQLIDKRIIVKRERDDDSHTTRIRRIPTLFFVTSKGRNIKIEIGWQSAAFDYYELGCHVFKHAGFRLPEKHEKGAAIICVYCGQVFDRQLQACPKCKLIALN